MQTRKALVLLATVWLLLVGLPVAAVYAACSTPPEEGDWSNYDPSTRSITKVNVNHECFEWWGGLTFEFYTLHLYGKCHPTDCDWGVVSASRRADGWLYTTIDHGFATRYVWVKAYPGGAQDWLRVYIWTDFDDPSRTDYASDDWFLRAVDCATDRDGDRLADCYETNTGVYVSATDTGTNPNDPDTDDDGINDGDEVLGTVAGLDLPGMGANPLRKNIFLEYDWFNDGLECGNHSHRPTQAALDMVTNAFASAPVGNPDGTTGITVIHDSGQGGHFTGGNVIADADGVIADGVNGTEFQNHKAANFATNRQGYFHYVLLPHRYNTNSGSSGQAELRGNDLIVSLYCANSDRNVAHTIMHELGHNLGLRHGGDEDCNHKPNYNSVMNYRYQFPGVDNNCTLPGDGVLDYSHGSRIDLDELNLNEHAGICGAVAWDWDGDGRMEALVTVDINSADSGQNAACGGTFTLLQDHDDWANLTLAGGLGDADGASPLLAQPEIVSCENPAPL
jgi:hypothetical protein